MLKPLERSGMLVRLDLEVREALGLRNLAPIELHRHTDTDRLIEAAVSRVLSMGKVDGLFLLSYFRYSLVWKRTYRHRLPDEILQLARVVLAELK